jgi:hypothetical protein
MILAAVSTRSYDFTALGNSVPHAEDILMSAWSRHAAATGADPNMMRDMIRDGDVTMTPVSVGTVLRDGEPL